MDRIDRADVAQGHRLSAEAADTRHLRDLMSLMTLPALWLGREAAMVLQLMTEAAERLVRLDLCRVHVPMEEGEQIIDTLRVGGAPVAGQGRLEWEAAIRALSALPIRNSPEWVETPLGPMRVVRLSMGYSATGGGVWFGSLDHGFPSLPDVAFLRTAATLAATGLQSARMNRQRDSASRAKDEFLAMLGHELRNPLAPIFGALALIKQRAGADEDPAHAVIERQALRLSRLVDDLLDVSRIAKGKVDLRLEFVDVRSLVRQALEPVAGLIRQQRHELAIVMPEAPVHVLGDPARLIQVFSNLLTNAAKYTPAGGRLSVAVDSEGGSARVAVRDNGPGIGAELRPRLFHIFEQGRKSLSSTGGGLGIGLALVKNLTELHHGAVGLADNLPGSGSVFTVTLPLAKPRPAVGPALDSPAPTLSARGLAGSPLGIRVMVVDDNQDAADALSEMLGLSGFDVAVAFDPLQALNMVDEFNPEVAVLDIGLPVMSGYELAAKLRLRPNMGALRLFALSGFGQASDHQKSAAAGFERHFVKPVDFNALELALSAR